MDVHGDGTRTEAEGRVEQEAAALAVVPSVVQRAIAQRVERGQAPLVTVDLRRDAGFPTTGIDVAQPLVAQRVEAGQVDHRPPPRPAGLLDLDRLGGKPLRHHRVRPVEPGDDEQRLHPEFGEVLLLLEVGVLQSRIDRRIEDPEQGKLAVDAGLVDGRLVHLALGRHGVPADAQGHAVGQHDDPEPALGGLDPATPAEQFPPALGGEMAPQGFLHRFLELLARDGFDRRAIQRHQLRGIDLARHEVGLGHRQRGRFVPVADDHHLARAQLRGAQRQVVRQGPEAEDEKGEETEAGDHGKSSSSVSYASWTCAGRSFSASAWQTSQEMWVK